MQRSGRSWARVWRGEYQQSSLASDYPLSAGADPRKADPDNALLWRMRLRRLESEAIRDSMLAVSGTLNLKIGGPVIFRIHQQLIAIECPQPTEDWMKKVVEQVTPAHLRKRQCRSR